MFKFINLKTVLILKGTSSQPFEPQQGACKDVKRMDGVIKTHSLWFPFCVISEKKLEQSCEYIQKDITYYAFSSFRMNVVQEGQPPPSADQEKTFNEKHEWFKHNYLTIVPLLKVIKIFMTTSGGLSKASRVQPVPTT